MPEPSIGAPERTHPNYVTPTGFTLLKKRRQAATDPREVDHFEREIESAIVVQPPAKRDVVAFGAAVHVRDGEHFDRTFTIVGDDEADVAAGKISFTSPLAEALIGARIGEKVVWHRPIGDRTLEVVSIAFDVP